MPELTVMETEMLVDGGEVGRGGRAVVGISSTKLMLNYYTKHHYDTKALTNIHKQSLIDTSRVGYLTMRATILMNNHVDINVLIHSPYFWQRRFH